MKDKIGIITLFGYSNYGNRLQMYASQKIYESLKFEAEIIRYTKKKSFFHNLLKKTNLKFKGLKLADKLKKEREDSFKDHALKKMKESNELFYYNKLDNLFFKNYNYYSIGSDQIWNPDNYKRIDFNFLKDISCEKKVAFAPSFSVDKIPAEFIDTYKRYLNDFKYLSVRESKGKKIIKDLTGKDIPVLLDPTMTLEKKEWLEFIEDSKLKPNSKYILTYFLGDISPKAEDILLEYKNKNYSVIKLNSLDMPEYYSINPSEWVSFLKDASLFLTDSFHGVAFSHIFKVPFVVYNRIGGEKMNSRITNILKVFNTEDRFELNFGENDLFETDFSKVDDVLKQERSKTYTFLKKALGDK